jgi:hypothetical protein
MTPLPAKRETLTADCPLPTANCLLPTAYCFAEEGALAASGHYLREPNIPSLSARSPPRSQRRNGAGRFAPPAGDHVCSFYRQREAKT